jgi:hypothetical protein
VPMLGFLHTKDVCHLAVLANKIPEIHLPRDITRDDLEGTSGAFPWVSKGGIKGSQLGMKAMTDIEPRPLQSAAPGRCLEMPSEWGPWAEAPPL